MAAPSERTGVVRDETTGELILPATQRPDGTWRKPRRVKDGYIPQEEVPVYESKGMQFVKSKPDHPIGLSPDDVQKMRQARLSNKEETPSPMSKSAKKNAKRKEKKKQNSSDVVESEVNKATNNVSKLSLQSADSSIDTPQSQEELAKKIKNLKKKLRQIEDLEAKIKSGEIAKPEKEQLEKVGKKQSVIDEIEDLELDLED